MRRCQLSGSRILNQGLGTKEDISRLQVTVDDASLMGVVNGLCQRGHEIGSRRRGLRLAVEPGRQTATLHVLHGEERLTVALADLVNLDNVRVYELRCRLRFGAETRPLFWASGRRPARS